MGFQLLTILLGTCIGESFESIKVDENCLTGFPIQFHLIYLLGVIPILILALGRVLVHLRFVIASFFKDYVSFFLLHFLFRNNKFCIITFNLVEL